MICENRRRSILFDIVRKLLDENLGEVLIAEPNLKIHSEFTLGPYEAVVAASDIILLLVDHKEFRDLKAVDLKEKILIDTRGIIV